MTKRIRTHFALVAAAAAVILGCAGLTWRSHVAADRWQQALDEARVLETRLAAQVEQRQALWGETTDERAQPHYDQALALVATWDRAAFRSAIRAEDEQARARRAAFVAAGSEALEALRRGAHAVDATRSVDWSRGFEVPIRSLMQARYLTQLCEMKAAILSADGRELEAVDVLLDALQFAGDMSQGPLLIEEMIGLALLSPEFLLEHVADGTLSSLSDDARERLAAGVTALDRRLGWRVRSFDAELALSARGLARVLDDDAYSAGEWMPENLNRTRQRLYAAEHLTTMRRLCDEYERAFHAGPQALLDEFVRVSKQSGEPQNPVSARILTNFASVYRGRLCALARFRLLAHAISGSEQPEDPWLAQYLRTEATDVGARLWLDDEVFGAVEIHVAR